LQKTQFSWHIFSEENLRMTRLPFNISIPCDFQQAAKS
jgi:hypothetical protein